MKTNYQSRWGYHPCDRKLFEKLKRMHKWYWQTVYAFHRWFRWYRKEPQNRCGPEPPFCSALVVDKIWHKPVQRRGEMGYKLYPKTVTDREILKWFHAARLPNSEPVEPFDAETVRQIEVLYATLVESGDFDL